MLVDINSVTQCMVVSSRPFSGRLPITSLHRNVSKLSVSSKGCLRPVSFAVSNPPRRAPSG
jgi:hypothetical protein